MPSVPNNCRCWLMRLVRYETQIIKTRSKEWLLGHQNAPRADCQDPPPCKKTLAKDDSSVARRCADLLHHDRHADGCGVFHLHQRIGNIHICCEYGAAERPCRVDRIGGGSINRLHVVTRASDGDACGFGMDLHNLLSGGEHSRDSWMHLYLASHPCVEGEMQLAGHDLSNTYLSRMAYQLRRQVKSPVARFHIGQIDFSLYFVPFELTNDPLRPTNPNLRFGNGFRADFQLTRHVLKHNRSTDSNFGRLFVS